MNLIDSVVITLDSMTKPTIYITSRLHIQFRSIGGEMSSNLNGTAKLSYYGILILCLV